MTYHTRVVGVTFEGRQEIIKDLVNGSDVVFERDKKNKYDANAVKVIVEGKHIGFLPRGNWVYKEIDSGKKFKARVAQITGGHDNMSYGVNVDFEIV